jgi:hypothetical protein
MQSELEEHEMASRSVTLGGTASVTQFAPPSAVFSIAAPPLSYPTAMQSDADGQATALG